MLVNCLFGAGIGYGLDLIEIVFIQLVMDLVEM